ncbi:hypothetical protein Emtol_0159 (plasmid) [Emticicia oligotrophica DSM 17448]|uniref:Cytochrome c7-like domain-containing protein n=1 Tax=Emticicia oligotrophica (strain DSM 17448 / CIP 109782 / MTCC 6937 / GPTSA100-15) TaxID=929562 RepID=A0ABM5N816_EMTOG|nr:cytochrome c3 family protein [Emticicia oligotrophica]AFK05674.1 hypothetical protein Emtol_0159 [Emticicia oligotrophica DSM 17448]
MCRLSFIILLFLTQTLTAFAQSPHGKNFTMDCAKCHNASGWTFNAKKTKFNHDTTGFALSGQHRNINCKTCHTTLNFKKGSPNCASCHTDLHNNTVGKDCARCHSTQNWIVSNITKLHEETSFPLTGVHATIDCKKCHQSETNVRFNPIGLECKDCHTKDFKAAVNPNHQKLNLSTDCASCHTATPNWKPAKFLEHDKFYPLTGAHATIAKDCEKCHINGNFNNTPTECVGCHKTDFNQTANPNHPKLNLSTDCASCHTTKPSWNPASFPVHDNFYPLTGAHKSIANNCVECHKGNYKNTSNDCNSCHNTAFNKTTNPNHKAIGISPDCASCHSTNPGWSPARFDSHNNFYPLTGGHTTIRCNDCHKGSYKNTPTDCNACHNTNYQKTVNPSHQAFGFSTECSSCHTTNPSWRPARFDAHNNFFPLTGAHASVSCQECHKGGNYKNTPKDCNSCHNAAYKTAKSPEHAAMGLSTDCASCHTTNPGWKPSTFNHNVFYPLTGGHAVVASNCASCHKGDVKNTPKDCNACHNDNFKRSVNPNHNTLNLSTDCASCHTTNPSWRPTSFNHNNFFPLTGGHAVIASNCASCHKGDVKSTPKDCASCHTNAFNAATNPNHAAAGFSKDCASCHTTNPGWRPSTFNHNNYYPLTGAHANIANNCTACHAGGRFKGTPTDCNSCHSNAYNGAANPNHAVSGFSRDCASCHTTNPGWRPANFNHNNFFPLTGAHTSTTCTACHIGGRFKGTPTDCNSCHSNAYNGAANPNHTVSGFSRDCASCHTTNPGWRPANFNHNNFFPLTGAHTSTTCTACHVGGRFKGTPTDCNSCHSNAYNGAANPNHTNINLSRDCASCHTTNPSWRPSTFNHNNHFPLVGAHARIASNCTQCHAGGNFSRSSCVDCHSGDYNRASPNHAASGFPTNCTQCHSQNAWKPANWNHDAMFPIYSGKHRGKWNSCTDCHTNSANYAVFSCFKCHSKTETDKEHKGKSGYIYESNACYSCHPRGDS